MLPPKSDDSLGVLNDRVCYSFEYTHVSMVVVVVSRISMTF